MTRPSGRCSARTRSVPTTSASSGSSTACNKPSGSAVRVSPGTRCPIEGLHVSALRRLPLLPALLGLCLSASLAACGDEPAPAEPTKERLDAVTISGDVGEEPEVDWSSQMTAGKIESKTLVAGDGAELAD